MGTPPLLRKYKICSGLSNDNVQFYQTANCHRCHRFCLDWYADCRNVHQSCCLWIEGSVVYHEPSPDLTQIGSTPNQHHTRRPRVPRTSTRTAAETVGLCNHRMSALELTVVRCLTDLSGRMVTNDGIWHLLLVHWWLLIFMGFHFTGQRADSVCGVVWMKGFWRQVLDL